MTVKFEFCVDYKPVGQGLFTSGTIRRIHESNPCFTWVYDCGSSDSPNCLTREIDRLTREIGAYGVIDVLILSHFDRDHINGVSELLRRFSVRRLFIPYLPIEDRLEIILDNPIVGFDYLQALINPARHFLEIGGDTLEQVISVGGGNHEIPPESREDPLDLPPDGPLDQMVKYHYENEPSLREEATASSPDNYDFKFDLNWQNPKAHYASDQHSLAIPGLWEFVFFCKKSKRATSDFIVKLQALVASWKWGDKFTGEPEQFVAKLKRLYEATFSTARSRNNISLIAYSGSICPPGNLCISCIGATYATQGPRPNYNHPSYSDEKSSHIYFGDITLSKRLLKEIKPHFGIARWNKTLAIQVPHHGAASSWFDTAALEFNHLSSIFSYGLHNSFRHPAKEVLHDLRSHKPLLVNELQGAAFFGYTITHL